ncbi:hypothetical protein BKA70DRAFT_175788 [Coprinopsis sp. MPI-PUGE-AT-0042]|nr:hypothetical protein BKA70DRAFT_175788 [Coprinopsis sp. MPI-PUGE-AT-0042]
MSVAYNSSTPLLKARLASLNLTSALATVAACLGLNALIRSNQLKSSFKSKAPPPTRVEIDTEAILNTGIVATVGCILLAGFCFIFASMTLIPKFRRIANKTLKVQAGLIAFSAIWIFACMVPYMKYYLNDSAGVKAFIGSTQLPDSLVKSLQEKSGSSSVYKDMWFLRPFAILPWISIASALATIPILLRAAKALKSVPSDRTSDATSDTDRQMVEKVEA